MVEKNRAKVLRDFKFQKKQSAAGQTRHTGSSQEIEEVVIDLEFLADNNIRKKEQTEKYQD